MNGNSQSLNASLSGQHDRLDAQIEQVLGAGRAGRWADYRAHFGALREGLMLHMAFEDEALYPGLEAREAGAVRALRAQHAHLRRLLEILGAAAPEQDPEGCLSVLEDLAGLLRAHHAAEMALDPPYAPRPMPALPLDPAPAIDLRGLQPPEPIVRIFQQLELGVAPLRVILPHEPLPLYSLLRERGYSYAGSPIADGGFEVIIQRA